MARKTIRVEVPVENPSSLIGLCLAIVKRHKKPGSTSPITDDSVKIDEFESKAKEAGTLQTEIDDMERTLQEKIGQRDQLLGIADGQNSQTKGTLHFETLQIRDILLGANRGNENALEPWGFGVVLGEAKSPKKKAA